MLASAFIGPCPNGFDVNHKNGIKSDNRQENIEYVTKSQNMRHALALGLLIPKGMKGEAHFKAKLTDEDVRAIRIGTLGYRKTAEIYGVDRTTIRCIRIGRTWTHVR